MLRKVESEREVKGIRLQQAKIQQLPAQKASETTTRVQANPDRYIEKKFMNKRVTVRLIYSLRSGLRIGCYIKDVKF